MKYNIRISSKFKKSHRKALRQGVSRKKIDSIIYKLAYGKKLPFRNKTHKLKGEFIGYLECHIDQELLLIYKYHQNPPMLELSDIGSHSDLFK